MDEDVFDGLFGGALLEEEVPGTPAKAKAMAKASAPDEGEGPPPKARAKGKAKAKAEAGAPAEEVPAPKAKGKAKARAKSGAHAEEVPAPKATGKANALAKAGAPAEEVPAPKATGKANAMAKAGAPAEEVPAPKAKGKAKAKAKAGVHAEEVAGPAEGESANSSSIVTAGGDDADQLAIGHDHTKVFCNSCKSWVNYQRCRVMSKQEGPLWKGIPLSSADASISNSVLLQQCIATRCCLCIGHFLPVALRHLDVGVPIPVQQGRGGAATAV